MPPPRPSQTLPQEVVEEFLLRLPPAEPASLIRAAAVCKRWRRLISGRGFRRRFREFHRAAPMLGVLCNFRDSHDSFVARFVPTSPCPPSRDQLEWLAVDSRHGRVLLRRMSLWGPCEFALRDLVTNQRLVLPPPPTRHMFWNAAVFCASASGGCDHLDCHRGHFSIVFVGTDTGHIFLCVYSSESESWSKPSYAAHPPVNCIDLVPSALVRNALYFVIDMSSILKYNVATGETSLICLPPESFYNSVVLTTMEDGALGAIRLEEGPGLSLSLWSMEASRSGDEEWTQIRVIKLDRLLNVDPMSISFSYFGFAHGLGVLFMGTDNGLFSIDLASSRVRKVCEQKHIYSVIPYISFFTPALDATFTDEEPGVGASGV